METDEEIRINKELLKQFEKSFIRLNIHDNKNIVSPYIMVTIRSSILTKYTSIKLNRIFNDWILWEIDKLESGLLNYYFKIYIEDIKNKLGEDD